MTSANPAPEEPAPRLVRETLRLKVSSEDTLALHRIRREDLAGGEPVLLLHGSIENGRIFYSPSFKGFAPELARQGFDAFVLDFRGRGDSTPPVSRRSRYGLWETIEEDLPRALVEIEQVTGRRPRLWIAHSWGGVVASAYLARHPAWRSDVKGLVCFGSKRCIRVKNFEAFTRIDLGWNGCFAWIAALVGYLPGRALGFGSDNESRRSHLETRAWVRPGPWIDSRDGFDYAAALDSDGPHPPVLHVTGERDTYLGHPDDVRRFAEETRAHVTYLHLARARGHARDYDHVDMLTAPEARADHFPKILAWMREALRG